MERINEQLHYDRDDDDGETYHIPDNVNLRERYPDHCVESNWYFPDYDRCVYCYIALQLCHAI